MGVQELAVVGLVGSGVGAALGLPMVWPRPDPESHPRVLGVAMLLMSAIAALISARLAGLVPASAAVNHAINVIGLTVSPLVVVYTRQATGSATGFGSALVLWAPAAAYGAVLAVRGALGIDTRIAFAWLLPVVLTFTATSAAVLWRRRDQRVAALLPPEWVVGFLVIVNVAQVVRMVYGHVPVVRAAVPLVFAGGFVAMVAFVAWRTVAPPRRAGQDAPGQATHGHDEPGLAAHGHDEPGLAAPDHEGPGHAAPLRAAAARYERSGLDERAALELLARVEQALTHDRLFARPDLTLAQLAGASGSTPHQVSEALNRYGGVTFHELVNRRRVDDVKAQLREAHSDRYTIEGIGASAGFGSRSALYAAFHRLEGMTPTAYRAALRRPAADRG